MQTDHHGAGISERQNHEKRQQFGNGFEEDVQDVARGRKLLHGHGRQVPASRLALDDRLFDQILQENEPGSEVSEMVRRIVARQRRIELLPKRFGSVHFLTVHPTESFISSIGELKNLPRLDKKLKENGT